MESRLPKPKIVIQKTVNPTEVIVNMNSTKTGKTQNNVPSSNGHQDKLQKAKSTLNLNAKVTNENKPPTKHPLVRSKTMSSITRGANVNAIASRAVKRPAGVATTHGDIKKPFTRTTVKPAQRTAALTSNSMVTKGTDNTNKKTLAAAPAKPSKWDLKGRLAHVSQELSSMKQKHHEVVAKYSELQEKINVLQTDETLHKTRLEELETSNKSLNTELNKLKVEINEIQEEREELSKQLREAEQSKENISNMLKQYKDRCASQEALISEHTFQVEHLRTNVESLTKTNNVLSTEREELQSLVHRMDKDRRILHNAIQELKGNIRVFCRVRPRTENENMKPLCAINFIDECTIEVGKSDGSDSISCSGKQRGTRQEFSFDKVFPPNATQKDIFEELSLLVQSALEGYNVCVFAYGQTGSGKTYTMEGLPGIETEGMIPRTVRHIFEEMKQFQLFGWEYKIEASFLEIYNEHIVDLLDSQPKLHEIRMVDSKGTDLYVSNLKVEEIHSPEELHECLLTAQRNRAVAATQSNERSSRSHSIARIRLIGTHLTKEEISIGNLNLVDLAGSERLKGEESVRMAETKNINKSLANLGNVILALLKKQEHVPYRNSKLTHLLMPSLGGNSKTLMLLNVSPLDECYNETLNSLRFASNVNNCKTGNVKRTRTILQNAS